MSNEFLAGIGALTARDLAMVVLLVKATIILIAALGITIAMQRTSAGARHLVWLVALGTLLVVPALTAWAPLRLEILPPAMAPVESALPPFATRTSPLDGPKSDEIVGVRGSVAKDGAGSAAGAAPSTSISAPVSTAVSIGTRLSAMSILSLALVVWALVSLVILMSLCWSALAVRRIVRRSRSLAGEDWVGPLYEIADRLGLDEAPRLLRSEEAKMPFACGVFRPTIVLPAESDTWTLDRRRAVLLHELAHVRRRDLAGHTLGRLACALYWFHPLVWTAARELRAESERACDDLALSCGTRAADYAEHLLDIVTSIRRDATPSVALAMARRKEFEGRMLAILDPQLRHSSPSRAQSTALIASLAAIALVVGAAAPARAAARPLEQRSAHEGHDYSKIQRTVTSEKTNTATRTATRTATSTVARDSTDRAIAPAPASAASSAAASAIASAVESAVATATRSASRSVDVRAGELRRLIAAAPRPGSRDPDDRPLLLAKVLRSDTSAALRRVAAWGLAEYARNRVAVDALADAVAHDHDEDVREMAAWALGDGDPDADSDGRGGPGAVALEAALKSDASERVRVTAAWALGSMGGRQSLDALVSALGDKNVEVRRRAAWGIGNVEPHSAPAQLIALLEDKDVQMRELAAWALYQIADPQAGPALARAIRTDTNKDLQLAYIRALAATGEKSVDTLRDLLESSDPRIKSMAVHALAGGDASGPWPWPWPEPRPYP
jgi:beta-lactamase regulating signal transducer with metallopeptidase domain/HEAT repeat protein